VLPQAVQVTGQGAAMGYLVPQWEQQEFFSNMGPPSLQDMWCRFTSKKHADFVPGSRFQLNCKTRVENTVDNIRIVAICHINGMPGFIPGLTNVPFLHMLKFTAGGITSEPPEIVQ